MNKDTWKYREELQTAVKYIKEKVDENHKELKGINGRLRKTEGKVTRLETLGGIVGSVFTGTIAWIFKKQLGG